MRDRGRRDRREKGQGGRKTGTCNMDYTSLIPRFSPRPMKNNSVREEPGNEAIPLALYTGRL